MNRSSVMNRGLLVGILSLSLSFPAMARSIGNPLLKGIVHSYDKDYVILKNGEKKTKVPRHLLPVGLKIKSQEYLEVEVNNEALMRFIASEKVSKE